MTAQTTTAPHEEHSTSYMVRVIAAASIGNALEWFDLLIYGYFAVTLSKLFFPAGSDFVALMLTFGTFAVAYLVRPLGAIVVGVYADRHGRKAALMLSILLMMIGTTIMTVVPTYASIGVAAPILVLVARLLQGFPSAANSAARPRSWSSIRRPGRVFSPAGSGRAKVWPRCSPRPSASFCSALSPSSNWNPGAGACRSCSAC